MALGISRIGFWFFVWLAIAQASAVEATSVTLSADRAAPQAAGTLIRWSASASGGTAPYSFKWWIYDGSRWAVLKDWNMSASYDWSPTIANPGYRVGVWVRSAGKTTDVDEANEGAYFAITPPSAASASGARVSAVTLIADRAAPQPPGTVITWTAQATGGSAPLSYKWWLWDGSAWALLRDWGPSATYLWTPALANGAYRVGVWVKSAGNGTDADEANQGESFAVVQTTSSSSRVTAVTLAADRLSPQQVGTAVTFTASPSGGTAPHAFKWWIFDGTQWALLRDWSTEASYLWTPSASGSAFRIGVWVKSAGNSSQVDEANEGMAFTVVPASAHVTAVTLTPDRAAPQPVGTTVRWTAAAIGGTGPISYKWWVNDGLGWRMLADWSTRDVVAWTPPGPNEAYRIGVWARSAPNTSEIDEANLSQPFPIRGGVPDCLANLDPALITFGSGGGSGSVQVSPATETCAWEVNSQATWVSVTSPGTGAGTGTVRFAVAPNPDRVSRTGYVMIGPRALTITQGGISTSSGCTYAVYPTALDVGFGNESGSIAVTAPAGCAWSVSGGGFTSVTPASGVGSGTLTISIDNNTAPEGRGTVLTVAGRAVTITQAGREGNTQGCTYGVSPAEAAFDFRAASGSARVTTPAGCTWTAVTLSPFVRLTGETSGSGTGTVPFIVETNGSSAARSGLVMIAGEALTVTQGGSTPEPACEFTLSSSSATVSYAGGRAVVSVTTSGGCPWTVTSHTDWLHVSEMTGPGNGSVWYDVDANSGSARAGTLVVAGQTLTISQDAPPVNPNLDEITWSIPPDPERVGQCWGNCGAGCGTFFNPCGGPHYWEHTVIGEPQYLGDDWEPVCTESSSWFVVRPRYQALARWTYHGLKSSKCEEHDETCRNLNFIPFLPIDKVACLATAGLVGLNGLNYCADAQPFDWSYEFVDIGHGAPAAYIDGVSSCN